MPLTLQVNAQSPVPGESIPHPVGSIPVFDHDDDPTILVEIPHRYSVPPARASAERFDDERVVSRVGGPRNARHDCGIRNGVCHSHYGSRESHEPPLRRLAGQASAATDSADRQRDGTKARRQKAT